MAALIGGKEYYTDAIELTSGAENCFGVGRVRGIFIDSATSCSFIFPSATITFTPAADSIIPFAPQGVTFGGGAKAYGLF